MSENNDNKNLPAKQEDVLNPQAQEDFDFARSTVYGLAQVNAEAIETMLDIFRQSEHPRAGEVLSNMIKQNAELAAQLLDMQEKKNKLSPTKHKEEQKAITNNNVFVGTVEELQRMLIDEKAIEHGDG